MANTFSWSFEALYVELGPDAESHTDIVMNIHWRYSATDGESPPHTVSVIGTAPVTWTEGDPWLPYEDLTEADVQGWTEEQLGEEQIEAMQASFDAQIAEQINPTHETFRTMPWNEDSS